jgi:hypothetical protein
MLQVSTEIIRINYSNNYLYIKKTHALYIRYQFVFPKLMHSPFSPFHELQARVTIHQQQIVPVII